MAVVFKNVLGCCTRENQIQPTPPEVYRNTRDFHEATKEHTLPVYESYLCGLIPTKTESPRWGRLLCLADTEARRHIVVSVYNKETAQGYFDDTPLALGLKALALLPGHLALGIIETLFHATMLGIAYQLCYGKANGFSKYQILRNCGRSLADIFRTPLYRLAALVVAWANIFFPIYKTSLTYDLRDLQGALIYRLHRGSKNCKQPRPDGYFLPLFFNTPICCQSSFLGYPNNPQKSNYSHVFYPKNTHLARLTNLALDYLFAHELSKEPYISPGLTAEELQKARSLFPAISAPSSS
jgi:hypothetical protein